MSGIQREACPQFYSLAFPARHAIDVCNAWKLLSRLHKPNQTEKANKSQENNPESSVSDFCCLTAAACTSLC